MRRYSSKHHLPMNSILFKSRTSSDTLRPSTAHTLGLVNVYDAQDTSITALPQIYVPPRYPTPGPPKRRKKSACSRVLSGLKTIFCCREQPTKGRVPTESRHRKNGGRRRLKKKRLYALPVDAQTEKRGQTGTTEGDHESDWEDIEEI